MNKGIRYNDKKLRWRNFPLFLFKPVVEVGAAAEKRDGNPTGKYPTYNFLQGLSVADTLDSLHRHLDQLVDPYEPDIDPEDGCHHLAKVAWNALVALHYINRHPELDDRYKINNTNGEIPTKPFTYEDDEDKKIVENYSYNNKHKFKYEPLDRVKVGALIVEVIKRMYDEDFNPVYILKSDDGEVFSEREYMLEMAPVKIEE